MMVQLYPRLIIIRRTYDKLFGKLDWQLDTDLIQKFQN